MIDYKLKYNDLLQENTKLKQGTLLAFQEIEIQDLQSHIHSLHNRNGTYKVGWKHTIKSFICIKWESGDIFTLQEFYKLYMDVLQKIYPDNHTIEASVQGTLQKLRDDKLITFLNRGSYSLI
jgi:hypothetical protein